MYGYKKRARQQSFAPPSGSWISDKHPRSAILIPIYNNVKNIIFSLNSSLNLVTVLIIRMSRCPPWTCVKMTTDSPVDSEGEVSELEAAVQIVPEVRLLHHNARVSLLLKMHTALHQQIKHKQILKGDFWGTFYFFVLFQHCFICRPSDSTVPTDAGIEPRTVATSALAVRRAHH